MVELPVTSEQVDLAKKLASEVNISNPKGSKYGHDRHRVSW